MLVTRQHSQIMYDDSEYTAAKTIPVQACYSCYAKKVKGLNKRNEPDFKSHMQPVMAQGAVTSKIKHATKLKTSPARLAQLLQPSLAFCFSALSLAAS